MNTQNLVKQRLTRCSGSVGHCPPNRDFRESSSAAGLVALGRIPRSAMIGFLSGRTSGYMLRHIVAAYGGALPGDIAAMFANAGMEHPATLASTPVPETCVGCDDRSSGRSPTGIHAAHTASGPKGWHRKGLEPSRHLSETTGPRSRARSASPSGHGRYQNGGRRANS